MSGAESNPGVWRKSHRAEPTIMISRDRAGSWIDASRGLPDDRRANIEAMGVAAYPGGFTLFAGSTDGEVYGSDDQAQNWTHIAGGLAPVSKVYHYRNLQPA